MGLRIRRVLCSRRITLHDACHENIESDCSAQWNLGIAETRDPLAGVSGLSRAGNIGLFGEILIMQEPSFQVSPADREAHEPFAPVGIELAADHGL